MDKYFISKQNEIKERLIKKSTEELIDFLGLSFESEEVANAVITEFKNTLMTI